MITTRVHTSKRDTLTVQDERVRMMSDYQVWVGCLACYNNGNLNGEWVDAEDAPEWECKHAEHEETWCLDHDMGPWIEGECSPQHAADVASRLQEIEGNYPPLDVIAAYCDNFSEDVLTVDLDLVEEAYEGEWQTWRDYADNAADDLVLGGREDTLAQYFDYEAWARDLECDYWTAPASNYHVHVFRNL
jgi:antirestriction protein